MRRPGAALVVVRSKRLPDTLGHAAVAGLGALAPLLPLRELAGLLDLELLAALRVRRDVACLHSGQRALADFPPVEGVLRDIPRLLPLAVALAAAF